MSEELLHNLFPRGLNDPDLYRFADPEIQRQLQQNEPSSRYQANTEAIRQVTLAVDQGWRQKAPLVAYLGAQEAQRRLQGYSSEEWRMALLYFAMGAFIFWADPLITGTGLAAGSLLSAWEPLVEEGMDRIGNVVHILFKLVTGKWDEATASEWDQALNVKMQGFVKTWLVAGPPALYFATYLPLIGSYISLFVAPITGTYALTCGLFAGNRFFRHINAVHKEHHPEPKPDAVSASYPIVERVKQLWRDRVVPAWTQRTQNITPIIRLILYPWRVLDEKLTQHVAYKNLRDWLTDKAGLLAQGASTSYLLSVGLFGAWMCMADSPHIFTITAVVTAYFAATTQTADLSLNPLTRLLSPLVTNPVVWALLGITYIGAKIVAFGFATGLAVSSYMRGPYSLPVYQVIAFAFTSTWTEDLFAVAAGVAAGGQLWQQSQRLYKDRPQNLPTDLPNLLASRAMSLGNWFVRFAGEGMLAPLGRGLLRLTDPLFQAWFGFSPIAVQQARQAAAQ